MVVFLSIMKSSKKHPAIAQDQRPAQEIRNPELIEKFYKQIINSFGYAYPGKA